MQDHPLQLMINENQSTMDSCDVTMEKFNHGTMDIGNEPISTSRVEALTQSIEEIDESSTKFEEHNTKEKETAIKKIAKGDAKDVRNMKIVILFMLLVTMSGALAVYMFTRNSEEARFEQEFEDDANKVRFVDDLMSAYVQQVFIHKML